MTDAELKITCLAEVLESAAPRPPDSSDDPEVKKRLRNDKTTYASRFANAMAVCIANGLREQFPGILPDEFGRGVESPAQSVRGPKKLDVNYSTPQLGLGFGISLKSVHFKEKDKFGYTHNRKRNDEELRTEAAGYHQRQPYAVMIAVVFLPNGACLDATPRGSSSFGAWVKYLRPLAGRHEPHGDIDRYERVFVALYDPEGTNVEFFDVEKAPPKTGRPRELFSYQQFLDEVEKSYLRRNVAEFEWDDGSEERQDEILPDEEEID